MRISASPQQTGPQSIDKRHAAHGESPVQRGGRAGPCRDEPLQRRSGVVTAVEGESRQLRHRLAEATPADLLIPIDGVCSAHDGALTFKTPLADIDALAELLAACLTAELPAEVRAQIDAREPSRDAVSSLLARALAATMFCD